MYIAGRFIGVFLVASAILLKGKKHNRGKNDQKKREESSEDIARGDDNGPEGDAEKNWIVYILARGIVIGLLRLAVSESSKGNVSSVDLQVASKI